MLFFFLSSFLYALLLIFSYFFCYAEKRDYFCSRIACMPKIKGFWLCLYSKGKNMLLQSSYITIINVVVVLLEKVG